jgi:hypothetical protein
LLLGAGVSGAGILLGRCFGIALLGLGLACWPSRQRAESDSPAFRGMLIYNVLIALTSLTWESVADGSAVYYGQQWRSTLF